MSCSNTHESTASDGSRTASEILAPLRALRPELDTITPGAGVLARAPAPRARGADGRVHPQQAPGRLARRRGHGLVLGTPETEADPARRTRPRAQA